MSMVPNTAVALIFLVGTYAIRRAALINQGLIFTGVAYLLVYIGAIAILFLFVIILVDTQNLQIETAFESRLPAFGLGLLRYLLCTLPGSNYLNVQNSHIMG
jgi:NADH:ubiquinone oxidoreductase subunit 6 (subunit J)